MARTASIVLLALAAAAHAQMLTNGGFEAGPLGGTPSGWGAWGDVQTAVQDGGSPFLFDPTPPVYEGSYSYAEGDTDNGGQGGLYQVVTVTPGFEATLSGLWAGGDDSAGDWHEAGVFEGQVSSGTIANASGNLGYVRKTGSTWGWESFEVTFTPASTKVTVYTKVGSSNGAGLSYANWFDDLKVEQDTGIPSPAGWLAAGWNLIGVPVNGQPASAGAVFEDLAAAGNTLGNSLFRYGGTYEVYPSDFNLIDPDTGYWLYVTNPTDVSVEGTETVSPYTVPLLEGWNLIAPPLNMTLPFDHLAVAQGANWMSWDEAVGAGLVDALMFAYVPGTGYVTAGAGGDWEDLSPWRGYWLRTTVPGLEIAFHDHPAQAPPNFVTREGREFYVNGQPLRFVGFNVRGMAHYGEGDVLPYSHASNRTLALSEMQSIGAKVARIFVSANTASRTETGDRLETCLNLAEQYDCYLIVAFTDQYSTPLHPQGDDIYYTWTSGGYTMLGLEFYSYGYEDNYLPQVEYLVNRFKDHPRVFSWQIGNELKYPDNTQVYIVMNQYVATAIRSIDQYHLISTGTAGRAFAWLTWSEAILMHDGYFDFLTVHVYNGSDAHDDSGLSLALDMPFIVSEAGYSDGYGDRPTSTDADIAKWVGRGARGYMNWGFMPTTYDNGDGDWVFGIDRALHDDYDDYMDVYEYWATEIMP